MLLGVFPFQAFAQEATIVGTVTDPAGPAIPNATITITATGTEQVRRLTSNDTGQFVAPDLHIGQYIVRVEAAGFKSVERSGVVLAVGDRSRIDVQMQIGDTKESIAMEAAAIAVQTDSGEVSDVITGQQVSQLATNGRSLHSLAMLTPGASSYMSDFQSPTPVGGDAGVSFNGMRQNHNLWMIDGGEDSTVAAPAASTSYPPWMPTTARSSACRRPAP